MNGAGGRLRPPATRARPRDAGAYAALLRRLHAPDPGVNRLILAALPGIERDYPIRSMPRLPVWHRGRVVLVGDAAPWHRPGPPRGSSSHWCAESEAVFEGNGARRDMGKDQDWPACSEAL